MPRVIDKVRRDRSYSVLRVCKSFDITRDAYYKKRARTTEKECIKKKVLSLVIEHRLELPREGVKKLYRAIEPDLKTSDIKFGRDKLFDLLREYNLLIKRRKKFVHTTNSHHRFHKYGSLLKDFTPTGPNQVWVSDITYIRKIRGFCFLAIVTDAYSRKIVGYDLSDSLELAGCLRALKRALRQLPKGHRLIHHSDRGIQYCSNEYVETLKRRKIRISMTEENHCYENAIAERVNGILKDEFFLDEYFQTTLAAKEACDYAIKHYNNKRLHLSLNYKTPEMVHQYVA
jgi:transposase InsO family protein